MKKRTVWIAAAVVVAAGIFGFLSFKVAGAYAETDNLQMRLDQTNQNLRELRGRVQDLERLRERDARRISGIEAYLSSQPWK